MKADYYLGVGVGLFGGFLIAAMLKWGTPHHQPPPDLQPETIQAAVRSGITNMADLGRINRLIIDIKLHGLWDKIDMIQSPFQWLRDDPYHGQNYPWGGDCPKLIYIPASSRGFVDSYTNALVIDLSYGDYVAIESEIPASKLPKVFPR